MTVLDFTQYLAGPACTKMLAELGADVIKVEMTPFGDPQRGSAPRKEQAVGRVYPAESGQAQPLCRPWPTGGIALVKELVPHVDVVVENYSAGVMDRRGLGL